MAETTEFTEGFKESGKLHNLILFSPPVEGKVIITCLPRVETLGLKSDSVNALTDRIRQSMQAVFEVTSAEVCRLPASAGTNTNGLHSSSSKSAASENLVQ